MDRSFLSQPDVVAASRDFVCVRLTTYEDEVETAFSRSLFIGRSGDVENTTFVLLGPDGRKRLTRVGRSTRGIFSNAADMANSMREIASRYPVKPDAAASTPPLPITLDVRLGLDVAASDSLPLVVVVAADETTRTAMESRVAKWAWDREFIGRFTYATTATSKDLKGVAGVSVDRGVIIIAPDNFGQSGKVIAQLDAGAKDEQIANAMRSVLANHQQRMKSMREHRADGIRAGAFWEPRFPVTDREEVNAREQARRAIERAKR
jgi:hypothetical protein